MKTKIYTSSKGKTILLHIVHITCVLYPKILLMFRSQKTASKASGKNANSSAIACVAIKDISEKQEIKSITPLPGAKEHVNALTFIHEHRRLLAACEDGCVRIYNLLSDGHPSATYAGHSSAVRGVAILSNDLFVSVGCTDCLVLGLKEVGAWKHKNPLTCVLRLVSLKVIIGDLNGDVIVLSRDDEQSPLTSGRQLKRMHRSWVHDIAVSNSVIVSCSAETVHVWDSNLFSSLGTIARQDCFRSVAASGKYIFCTALSGIVYVHENQNDFSLKMKIQTEYPYLGCTLFITQDILGVSGSNGLFGLISLTSQASVSRCQLSEKNLNSFLALSDGQVAVGDEAGFCCTFKPPQEARRILEDFAIDMHASLELIYKLPSSCGMGSVPS